MHQMRILAVTLPLSVCLVSAAFAGTLEKYGTPRSTPQESPAQQKSLPARPAKSDRQLAIERAVSQFKQATPERQQQLIKRYQELEQAAVAKRQYDAANFYHQILLQVTRQ